jgi:hypothetical protein
MVADATSVRTSSSVRDLESRVLVSVVVLSIEKYAGIIR